MALFKKASDTATDTSTTPKAVKAAPAKKAVAKKHAADLGASLTKVPGRILKGPHITEKATYAIEKGVYVFVVAADATKRDVLTVVKALYNVTPRKVNMIVKQPRKFVARTRGRRGTKSGLKKAYVFLKKGDTIEIH